MKKRKLGKLEVSAIGLGCMVMPGFYASGDEDESIATIHHAAGMGLSFLDTSDMYGAGKNEELVGRAIAGHRDEYVIGTKFGNIRTADGGTDINGRPEYVVQACEASLKRLGVDVIDLYYQHRVDSRVPIEETVGAMTRLVEQGKVHYLGLSEAAPETIRRAHAVHPIAALQTEYSLWTREAEAELLPLCAELDIGYVAYSPLGRGVFGGTISGTNSLAEDDRRRAHPRFQEDNLNTNLKLVEPVRDLAAAKGCQPAQLALAWVLAWGNHVVPIPGTRRRDHLEINAAALDIALTDEDLATLDAACPPGAAQGARYPSGAMKAVHF
jgi:aryl-alcohol dehydrogenase-like predicted oxidoreductase